MSPLHLNSKPKLYMKILLPNKFFFYKVLKFTLKLYLIAVGGGKDADVLIFFHSKRLLIQ
jgi:hypothetical protein